MIRKIGVIIIACFLLIGCGYLFYFKNFSNKAILNHVTNRDGYSLDLVKMKQPVEFYIKPEWIPFNSQKEKKYNIKLTTKFNTDIILSNVWNRGSDIYLTFTTAYHMKYNKGNLLYNGIFNKDSTFTTNGTYEDYYLYNKDGQQIDIGQYGEGPNSDFGFAIKLENYNLIKNGFYVKYSGFYLYDYHK